MVSIHSRPEGREKRLSLRVAGPVGGFRDQRRAHAFGEFSKGSIHSRPEGREQRIPFVFSPIVWVSIHSRPEGREKQEPVPLGEPLINCMFQSTPAPKDGRNLYNLPTVLI
jgi:hypothetical protein